MGEKKRRRCQKSISKDPKMLKNKLKDLIEINGKLTCMKLLKIKTVRREVIAIVLMTFNSSSINTGGLNCFSSILSICCVDRISYWLLVSLTFLPAIFQIGDGAAVEQLAKLVLAEEFKFFFFFLICIIFTF